MAPKNPEPSEKKPEATEETVTVKVADLQALMARIDKLEADAKAEREVEISTDTPAAAALKPGQYVNIAPQGTSPDFRKVRWTKTSIAATYPEVTFMPMIGMTVAPHGIPYELRPMEPTTAPSIVRDFYDAEFQRQKHFYDRYAPESPMEVLEGIQRSKANKGIPIWGRVHIVGDGLIMNDDQPGVGIPAQTGTETKA